MAAEDIGKAFVQHFYQTLDAGGAAQLATLYNPSSMLTFEGQQVQGADAIIQKYQAIGQLTHQIKSTDVQPSNDPNSVLIFVTGSVKIGGDNPLHFCEMFALCSSGGPGQYYVHNDVFRLNYGL